MGNTCDFTCPKSWEFEGRTWELDALVCSAHEIKFVKKYFKKEIITPGIIFNKININVIKGQKIKQGQVVGTLGKTGRATGPHLDIRLNWFDVKLDPMTILN